jgi:hypothetical protein
MVNDICDYPNMSALLDYCKRTSTVGEWLTLDKVGKQYGVTKDRIRQILSKAPKLAEGDPLLGAKGLSDIFAEKKHLAKCKEMKNRAGEKRLNRFLRKFERLIS